LDASALVKRYRQELGSEVVHQTIEQVASDNSRRLVVSSLSIIETLSILNRRRNEAGIPLEPFRRGLRGVIQEVRTFSHALLIDDHLLLSSAQYAIKHNINSADAIHLAILLALQATMVASSHELLCLAADKRLIRAARLKELTSSIPKRNNHPNFDVALCP
jgi:predicted nucleic acid-binding protein